jgi:circadian clock protein KaiC
MRSIGIDLAEWRDGGLLQFYVTRPTAFGLETHLLEVEERLEHFRPHTAIFDPISSLIPIGSAVLEGRSMVIRLMDMMKNLGSTALFTAISGAKSDEPESAIGISSVMDVWIRLRIQEDGGEQKKTLTIIKARGINHSHKIVEFWITDEGPVLGDSHSGGSGKTVAHAPTTDARSP